MVGRGNAAGSKTTQFKKGVSGNPKGRAKGVGPAIKALPPKAREEVCQILYHALTLQSQVEAAAYLRQQDMGEYGIVLQIACRELSGDNAWNALNDILDRLFGKPRISAEVEHRNGAEITVIVKDKKTAEEVEKLE